MKFLFQVGDCLSVDSLTLKVQIFWILILGGVGVVSYEDSIFQFQKESQTFVIIGRMQQTRGHHAVTIVKTDDYVCNFELWCILQKLGWVKINCFIFSIVNQKYPLIPSSPLGKVSFKIIKKKLVENKIL